MGVTQRVNGVDDCEQENVRCQAMERVLYTSEATNNNICSNLSPSFGTAATALRKDHGNGSTIDDDVPCVGVPTQVNQTVIVGGLYRRRRCRALAPLTHSCGRGDLLVVVVVARRRRQQFLPEELSRKRRGGILRRVHAQLQAHPCVETCRVRRVCDVDVTVQQLFNSTEHERTAHSHFSVLQALSIHEDRREAARKRCLPDRDRQSARQRHNFGMLSVCNHPTASYPACRRARCRCEARPEIDQADQPCMSHMSRLSTALDSSLWPTTYSMQVRQVYSIVLPIEPGFSRLLG